MKIQSEILNELNARGLRARISRAYDLEHILYQTPLDEWERTYSENGIRGAGIVILRKKDEAWHFLMGQHQKMEGNWAFPAGKHGDEDHGMNPDVETLACIGYALQKGLLEEGEYDPANRKESLAGTAIRELFEETNQGIRVTLNDVVGRTNGFYGNDSSVLFDLFVIVDDSEETVVADTPEMKNWNWVPIELLLQHSHETVTGAVEDYLLQFDGKSRLMTGSVNAVREIRHFFDQVFQRQDLHEKIERVHSDIDLLVEVSREFQRSIAVFGGLNVAQGHPLYEIARRLGIELHHNGEAIFRRSVSLITGGYGGIMEAPHKGSLQAAEGKKSSVKRQAAVMHIPSSSRASLKPNEFCNYSGHRKKPHSPY